MNATSSVRAKAFKLFVSLEISEAVKRHGVAGVNELLREAIRMAGLQPESVLIKQAGE
jgi:hypothetical protein